MGNVVLPCLGGQACVCPDGKLPCPLLSTCNALKMIQKKWDEVKNGGEPQALKEIERVFEKGVQVEWMEFEDYMKFHDVL